MINALIKVVHKCLFFNGPNVVRGKRRSKNQLDIVFKWMEKKAETRQKKKTTPLNAKTNLSSTNKEK